MSDDQQRTAEGLDPDEIGDDPSEDLSYPPDQPLGANDPTQDDWVQDSVVSRTEREEPDFGEAGAETGAEDRLRLLAPNDVQADDVAEAIATAVTPDEGIDDLSAEEAAVHTVE